MSVEYLATGKEIEVPQNKGEKSSLQEQLPDQTDANRILGIIVLTIALIGFLVLLAFKTPSWVVAIMIIPLFLAGCFILIFAGKFDYHK